MGMLSLRPAAVAGMFYPDDVGDLSASVKEMMAEAHARETTPKALIVPHAGYIYSGPVAASAYAQLRSMCGRVSRVVIFGPAHRAWIAGLAASSADMFETPLGRIPVDRRSIETVAHLPQVEVNDAAHAAEHSLEVQLPFLQAVLGEFSIVPFVVGGATGAQVAEVMDLLWGGPETLIVVSSDLSHYLPYAEAQEMDRATTDEILHGHALTRYNQACGATPINGLIEVARRRHLAPTLLDLRNSGDTAGDRSRVVGYAAFAFAEAVHE